MSALVYDKKKQQLRGCKRCALSHFRSTVHSSYLLPIRLPGHASLRSPSFLSSLATPDRTRACRGGQSTSLPMLGQLSFSRWRPFFRGLHQRILALIGLAIASGYSEVLQSFVPGRSASSLDALASTSGAAFGLLLVDRQRHRLADEGVICHEIAL